MDKGRDAASRPTQGTPADAGVQRRGVLLALIGAGCWGFSANCVSWLTTNTQADVLWLGNMRLIISGLIFLAVALVGFRPQLRRLLTTRSLWPSTVGYTLLGVILMQVSYMSAIKYTNPGTALLLQSTGMPMVLVVGCLKGRRLPSPYEWVSLALACLGVLMIACQGDIRTLDINPLGLFWGLGAGVAMAGYNLLSVRIMDEAGMVPLNAVTMLLGAAVLTPFVRPWEAPPSLGTEGWLVFAGVVLVGTILAYAIYLKGVQDAGPVKASLIGLFEPVSGAVIAALWLGTVFTGWDLLGGLLILAMMTLVALQRD